MKYLSLVAAFAVVAWASIASASVQFDLSTRFNHNFGGDPTVDPAGTQPWARVEIYDSDDVGSVTNLETYNLTDNDVLIVMSSLLQAPGESIVNLGLNYTGTYSDLTGANAMYTVGNFNNPQITNGATIDSASSFDLGFDFTTLLGGNPFDAQDKLYLRLSFSSDVDDDDFNLVNSLTNNYYAAIRVGGLDQATEGSSTAYVASTTTTGASTVVPAVPEPASMAIWGMGSLFGAVAFYRRKRRAG